MPGGSARDPHTSCTVLRGDGPGLDPEWEGTQGLVLRGPSQEAWEGQQQSWESLGGPFPIFFPPSPSPLFLFCKRRMKVNVNSKQEGMENHRNNLIKFLKISMLE